MSDEESFVILGSCSPGNSLIDDISLQNFQSLEQSKIEAKKENNATSTDLKSMQSIAKDVLENLTPTNSFKIEQKTEVPATPVPATRTAENTTNEKDNSLTQSVESNKTQKQNSTPQMIRSAGSGSSGNASLAASFIMGEINADILKSCVYSQFPSLCSMEACAEDVVKLQNFMSEYLELKTTLAKVNATMRQFYEKTQKWHADMERTEQVYKQQLQQCQTQIAKLSNENLELKQNMDSKLEQIRISEETQKGEVAKLIESLSEKSALIGNMREQISRLEQQQLASFEYIPKNANDTKENPDYIARSEHLHLVKELERKMSSLLAENLELKDMQTIYMDEINCLKVNLTAAEELLQQSRRDIETLKLSDNDKTKRFTEYEEERDKMREEIEILRQQVDVYSKDFQMERTARESIAGDKEQLMQDLRKLQRSNQELVEQLHKHLESAVRNATTATTSNANASTNTNAVGVGAAGRDETPSTQVSPRFIAKPVTAATFATNIHQRPIRPLPQPHSVNSHECPICRQGFNSLTRLQSHVNTCLDNAEAGR